MKWLIFVGLLAIPFFMWADDDNKTLSAEELEELSIYIGDQIEEESVDCSNILPFIEDYFKLSTANQLYLSMSANRLSVSVDQLIATKNLDKTPLESNNPGDSNQLSPCVTESSVESHLDGGENKNPKKAIRQDIACAVALISENEWTLSEQAEVIKEVLPTCLNQTTSPPKNSP